MAKAPSISGAQWQVMDVLWEAAPSPLPASEVVARLAGRNRWSGRTIKTLISRLVKKGAVGFSTERNFYLYRPLLTRQACVRKASRSFASRVFGGEVGPMLVQFVRQADLSPREIEELKKILSDKSKETQS